MHLWGKYCLPRGKLYRGPRAAQMAGASEGGSVMGKQGRKEHVPPIVRG